MDIVERDPDKVLILSKTLSSHIQGWHAQEGQPLGGDIKDKSSNLYAVAQVIAHFTDHFEEIFQLSLRAFKGLPEGNRNLIREIGRDVVAATPKENIPDFLNKLRKAIKGIEMLPAEDRRAYVQEKISLLLGETAAPNHKWYRNPDPGPS